MTLMHFDMRTFANFALFCTALAGLLVVSAGPDHIVDRIAATGATTVVQDGTHGDDQGWG